MRTRIITSSIGVILKYIGLVLLAPIIFALIYKEYASILPFVAASVISLVLGFLLDFKKVGEKEINEINRIEALATVFFAWVFFGLVCTIPYLFYGFSPLNALFEAVSGVTTTGATIITDFSLYPKTLFVFRSMTQWLGGMGIIVLFIAILPKFAVAGRQMFFAELPNVREEKITPRIKHTATWLWAIYIGLTVVQILLLKFVGGMNFHNAICCAFSTLAAGGITTSSGSVLANGNNLAAPIIIIFMFLAGTNFVLQYKVFIQRRLSAVLKSEEFLTYFGIIAVISTLIAVVLCTKNNMAPLQAITDAIFQSVSVITTTAFFSANIEQWHVWAKILLFALMFTGACAGSTSGGIKVARWVFVFKYLKKEISKIVHPQGIFPIKIEGTVVSEDARSQLIAFIFFFFVIFGISTFLVALIEKDAITALTGSISTLSNTGIIFGPIVGLNGSFFALAPLTKLIFIFNMLVGRLELVPFLALLHNDAWAKRG